MSMWLTIANFYNNYYIKIMIKEHELKNLDTEHNSSRRIEGKRGLALSSLILAVGALSCDSQVNSVTIQSDGCMNIDSRVEAKPFETSEANFDSGNLALEGLIANTTVKVDANSKEIKYSITAPETLHDNFYSNVDGDTIKLGFSCPEDQITLKRIPEVNISVPLYTDIDIDKSGIGSIEIGDTNGNISAKQSGSGDLTTGNVKDIDLNLSGSGEVFIKDVNGDIELLKSGSGDVSIESVESNVVNVRSSGSGDFFAKEGNASLLKVDKNGSGDFVFDGKAGGASIENNGSGDVELGLVDDFVKRESSGSGEISTN